MGIIIVSLLVAVVLFALIFLGTFAILAVPPMELWEQPLEVLRTVGKMESDTAQLHITLFIITLALLLVLALVTLILNLFKYKNVRRKEIFEYIFVTTYYLAFLLFLGNGIYYMYNLLVKFNPVL